MNPSKRKDPEQRRSSASDSVAAVSLWRKLTRPERRILIRNGNTADDWNNLHVKEGFRAAAVHGCSFIGINRIGAHTKEELAYQNLRLPVGMYHSCVISCEIGDNSAIHHVRYILGYRIGDEVMLFNNDEMIGGSTAGSGDAAPRIAVGNENGGRKIPLFAGMTAGDAFLCSRNRDRAKFQENLVNMAEVANRSRAHESPAAGRSGEAPYTGIARTRIGSNTVVKSCRCIENTTMADNTRITGANLLKDLTIDSSPESPTHIGEGVELVSGYIGAGCNVTFGVKAIRFSLATNVTLNNGARCIDSVLGDNITVSCCEVVSALVFPFHEQHHNNSFLIAATIQGQCDIAAGATIGSNHNSRAAEGEIFARRGFWPGLCVNLKLPSRFASFCLVAKGTYPAELDVPLPFTLVSNNVKEDKLQLYPGYWFKHNMYGLGRNSWKLKNRDARLYRWQTYEYDYLAPDSVEELFAGIELLEKWDATSERTEVDPTGIEASGRGVIVLNIEECRTAYRDMIRYYGIRTLLYYMDLQGLGSVEAMRDDLGAVSRGTWMNIGGQLMRAKDYHELITDVEGLSITSWEQVHAVYKRCAERYPTEKAKHALASLFSLHHVDTELDLTLVWNEWIDFGVEVQNRILNQTIESRTKDYQRWFRKMMYDSDAEMAAVLGDPDENEFIAYLKQQTAEFASLADKMRR